MTDLTFYFCGKIGRTDWRQKIVREPWELNDAQDREERDWLKLPIIENAIGPGLHYSGPFYKRCDHRCSHAPHRHGVLTCCHDYTSPEWQACISEAAQLQIERADIVFAWLEGTTCFGSLVEIGIARAFLKETWLAWPPIMGMIRNCDPEGYPRIRDLWFARSLASDCCMAESAPTAFRSFLTRHYPLSPAMPPKLAALNGAQESAF